MISGGRRATTLQVQVLIFCEVVPSHQEAGIGGEIPSSHFFSEGSGSGFHGF